MKSLNTDNQDAHRDDGAQSQNEGRNEGKNNRKYCLTRWIVVPVWKIVKIGRDIENGITTSSILNKFSMKCGCLTPTFWNLMERSWLDIQIWEPSCYKSDDKSMKVS